MSFLRPEAKAQLLRWRETLAGLGAAALGLWFALTAYGVLFGLGVVLLIGGGALAVAGVQRARFRLGSEGPGVVQVVEGRVTYFGPWGGGGASLDRLAWLELVPVKGGAGAWVLIEEEGERLEIPVDARGRTASSTSSLRCPDWTPGPCSRTCSRLCGNAACPSPSPAAAPSSTGPAGASTSPRAASRRTTGASAPSTRSSATARTRCARCPTTGRARSGGAGRDARPLRLGAGVRGRPHHRPEKDGANVSLEPGGQLELSGAPLETIHETCDEVNATCAR
jgi:hypothetical protein